jgi:aryl-alcohol dehydrogenase-like predicted oxidoreductase/DNA-binding NarL/FixJ family response regulator
MIARVGQNVPLEISASAIVNNSAMREDGSHSSPANILVIVSKSPHGSVLNEMLRSAGFGVSMVSELPPGLRFPLAGIHGAILFGSWLQCPTERICEICSAIRSAAPTLPLIVVGPDDIETKVRLFKAEADDYVVEPFDRTEFLARVSSLIRHSDGLSGVRTSLEHSEDSMSTNVVSANAAGLVDLGGELSVSRLGFGAMRLTGVGIWGPPKDRQAAVTVLRRAVQLGVNFIDTADSYGPNVSEELIAEALFPYPADLVIATKGGWNRPGPDQWTHNATPAHLRKSVEGSLKRLRLDRIDVYQLHTPDPVVSLDDSVGTLARLREEGKIRLVALSNVTQDQIELARKIVPIVSVQNRYNLADREWDDVVDYSERNGIGFIPWYPLAGGGVAGEVLAGIARKHNASPKQVALAWLLQRSPIMLPIPGTSSVEHLQENVRAGSLRLSAEEYEALSRVPPPLAK